MELDQKIIEEIPKAINLLLTENDIELFPYIMGWCGNVFAIIFLLSPVVLIYNLCKGNLNKHELSYFTFLSNILNCELWVLFSLLLEKIDWVVISCNGIGFVFNIIYLSIFMFWVVDKKFGKYLFIMFFVYCFYAAIFAVYVSLKLDPEWASTPAMVFNILMYYSPGQKLLEVIKHKNEKLIPIQVSVMGIANASCWVIYAISMKYWNIFIPNVIGIVFLIAQCIVWVYYWNYNKKNPKLNRDFVQIQTDEENNNSK